MSIIVEDGTGKADAESYCSVADASAYHAARGNAAWAALASDTIREQCLRRATDYMVQAYAAAWKGGRKTTTQALCWPRSNVCRPDWALGSVYGGFYPDNIVPEEVKRACAELALKASTEELAPDLDQAVASETVGPITTVYDKASPQFKRFRAIDMALRAYVNGNSVTAKVGRS